MKLDFFLMTLKKHLFESIELLFHLAHSPTFRGKSFISGKALHYKGLGHNFKDSDFHSTCPLIPVKSREAAKLHSISIFEVKSALNTAPNDNFSWYFYQR